MCFPRMRFELEALLRSFQYAFQGLWTCLRRERNLRIHLTAACWALWLCWALKLGRLQLAVLMLSSALVISLELVNTAIERLTDLACQRKWHPLAKAAKDTAAAAVLIAAAFAVGIGVCLFWRPELWALLSRPLIWAGILPAALLSLWFIFGFGANNRKTAK